MNYQRNSYHVRFIEYPNSRVCEIIDPSGEVCYREERNRHEEEGQFPWIYMEEDANEWIDEQ